MICRETPEAARRELVRITDVRASAGGYASYEQWLAGTKLEQRVSLEDYSVSNRGLRSGLVGTPETIAEQLDAFERAGVGLTLLQFSPQAEEMDRFAAEVIPLVKMRKSLRLSACGSADWKRTESTEPWRRHSHDSPDPRGHRATLERPRD